MTTEEDTLRKSAELLKEWKSEKRSIIHSNLKYRWISTVSALIIAFIMVYAFSLLAKARAMLKPFGRLSNSLW